MRTRIPEFGRRYKGIARRRRFSFHIILLGKNCIRRFELTNGAESGLRSRVSTLRRALPIELFPRHLTHTGKRREGHLSKQTR
jgi:hypothetical protein